MQKPKLSKNLDDDARQVAEGVTANPILIAAARAGWEVNRAFWQFSGAMGGQSDLSWDELSDDARQAMIQDAFALLNGAKPEDVYATYDHDGVLWAAAEPQQQLAYVLFAQTTATMFKATFALAQGAAEAIAGDPTQTMPQSGTA